MDAYLEETELEIERWRVAGRHIPSQTQIDIAAEMASYYKGNASESDAMREFLLPLGIGIRSFGDIALVYWTADQKVKAVAAANLKKLPEFLASEDNEIRQLAKWKLDELNK